MSAAERLVAAGMAAAAAAEKEQLFAQARAGLHAGNSSAEARQFWVPGRIEFLGKHTDYAGGRSLLCAVERGLCMVAAARRDHVVNVTDVRSGETISTSMDAALSEAKGPAIADVRRGPLSHYVLTVLRRLARNFAWPLFGADIAFASDLPIAAGISSSSALVVAIFLALADVNDLESRDEYRRAIRTRDQLGGYLGAVENGLAYGPLEGTRGVGTFGGSEDQTAILCARPSSLVQYSFCPVLFEHAVPLPDDHTFVVASSGVVAEKTGGALAQYNRLATLAREALDQWNRAAGRNDPSLGAAAAALPRELRHSSQRMTPELRDRVEQFVTESEEIIPAASGALAAGQLATLGTLVGRSMRNAEELLGNQVPKTIFLARSARELGAAAASAFGAGFGGSVWAFVPRVAAAEFLGEWQRGYAGRFPGRTEGSEFFVTGAGPAALSLDF